MKKTECHMILYMINKNIIASSVLSAVVTASLVAYPLKTISPAHIYAKVSPSVVAVRTYNYEKDIFAGGASKPSASGVGSGFIIDKKRGIIATNAHVIRDAVQVDVTFSDGKQQSVDVIEVDGKRDIALLHYKDYDANELRLCKEKPRVGDRVSAIGSPFGLNNTMTLGIISGLGRDIEGAANQESIVNMIQTDAMINPGNSGGPLVNNDGCVLGMNTAMITPGIGLAIPAEDIQDSFDVLVNGKLRFTRIGVELMPDHIVESLDLPGLPIVDVIHDSIAEELGLVGTSRDEYGLPKFGDIILEINSKPIRISKDIKSVMNSNPDILELTILRNGEKTVIKVNVRK